MPEPWSSEEIDAIIADYFDMLAEELRGSPFNKAAHRRYLRPLLNARNDASIERKHQNISAVLKELRVPWVIGYKPLGNYQHLLAERVISRINSDHSIQLLAEQRVEAPVPSALMTDLVLEAPPRSMHEQLYIREPRAHSEWFQQARVIDYFALESRNRSLAEAGEIYITELERTRLLRENKPRLAERVERISSTRGDGAGFDILSFERNGRERFIAVKTTSFAKETPFHVTRNEVAFSSETAPQYHLYRLFTFRQAPRAYTLSGSLESSCELEPTAFMAMPR